jgi:hypothetical protein
LIGLKCFSQCNGQPPRGSFACGIGNRYPVRNDDESRQRSAPRRLLSYIFGPASRRAQVVGAIYPFERPHRSAGIQPNLATETIRV